MLLNLKDRINILGILPQKGNSLTLHIVKKLREDLIPNDEEIKNWDIKQDGGRITWDDKKAKDVEFAFSEVELELIREPLSDLNKKGTLAFEQLDVYDKLMKG